MHVSVTRISTPESLIQKGHTFLNTFLCFLGTIFKNPSHKSIMMMTRTLTNCSVSFSTIGLIYLCKHFVCCGNNQHQTKELSITWHCMDCGSSCSVYVVQPDTHYSSYNTVAVRSIEQYMHYHLPVRSYRTFRNLASYIWHGRKITL
jgi:hypothetical protein